MIITINHLNRIFYKNLHLKKSISISIFKSFSNTVNSKEISKFSSLSNKWWDEQGDLGALHSLNYLRVPFIRKSLTVNNSSHNALEGLQILDVGCGAGILCEPLGQLGAKVLGLDACLENIEVAKTHLQKKPKLSNNIIYECLSIEDFISNKPDETKFDAVILSEVLEHVDNLQDFLSRSISLIKSNGSLIVTTINKTVLSYGLAILAAENIFKIVPKGTHEWNKFVPLNSLKELLKFNNMQTRVIHGMLLNPITLKWTWITDPSINYALHAVKNS